MGDALKDGRARKYALFTIVIIAGSFGNVSQTALSAMLTDVIADFGVTIAIGQWLTTGYMLMLGITMPLSSFLLKRFSLGRIIVAAIAVFTASAVLGLLAWDFWSLLASRILQAAAVGVITPLMQTMAMTLFPEGKRATAMGFAGTAFGVAPSIGPMLGGVMNYEFGWRSFFILLVAAGVILLISALFAIGKEEVAADKPKLDAASLILSAIGFGGVLVGLSTASSEGISPLAVWIPILAGAIALLMFVLRQKRTENPLISMDIFKYRDYTASFIAQGLLFSSFLGVTLVIPLFIEAFGGTTFDAGMVMLPSVVATLLANPVAGYATDRIGVRPVALFGGIVLAIGAIAMVFIDGQTPLWVVTTCQTVRNIGVASLVSPLATWGLSGLPRAIVQDGNSFSVATRQSFASFGTAIMVLIITWTIAASAPVELAYHLAFGFSALLAVATLVTIVARVR